MPDGTTTSIAIFEDTRELLGRIADLKRWTLKVTIDEAAKSLAEKLNLDGDGSAGEDRHEQSAQGGNGNKTQQ